MNWLGLLNESLDFIEENLTEPITGYDVAEYAHSSYHHYLRMFNVLSGMTLNEYIRNRRLSSAVADLTSTDNLIIDIAYKYQYSTPEAFTKAFKRFHGITPSEARKQGTFKNFGKLSFQLIVQGDKIMKFEIVKKGGLTFTGLERVFTSKGGENFKKIPLMWQEVMTDGTFGVLAEKSDELGIVGLCYDFNHETEEFKYMIGVRNKFEHEGFKTVEFDNQTFASFEAKGALPKSIQETTQQVFSEWFPSSNYEHSGGPEMEVYPMGDGSKEDYVCYYWAPVTEKKDS